MSNKLDPLPPSGDEFWQHAETNKIVMEEAPKCEHFFVRTKGTETECRKCRAGFFLTPEFRVKEGHIYQYDELVI